MHYQVNLHVCGRNYFFGCFMRVMVVILCMQVYVLDVTMLAAAYIYLIYKLNTRRRWAFRNSYESIPTFVCI